MTLAIPSVEFGLSPSPRQKSQSGLFHLAVLIVLLFANLPVYLLLVLELAVVGLYLRQRLVLDHRRSWRLVFERDRWLLDRGDGGLRPVKCEVHYLSRWLVALTLLTADGERHELTLFSDGMPGDDWRLLHVVARGMLRKPQGRLTMMS